VAKFNSTAAMLRIFPLRICLIFAQTDFCFALVCNFCLTLAKKYSINAEWRNWVMSDLNNIRIEKDVNDKNLIYQNKNGKEFELNHKVKTTQEQGIAKGFDDAKTNIYGSALGEKRKVQKRKCAFPKSKKNKNLDEKVSIKNSGKKEINVENCAGKRKRKRQDNPVENSQKKYGKKNSEDKKISERGMKRSRVETEVGEITNNEKIINCIVNMPNNEKVAILQILKKLPTPLIGEALLAYILSKGVKDKGMNSECLLEFSRMVENVLLNKKIDSEGKLNAIRTQILGEYEKTYFKYAIPDDFDGFKVTMLFYLKDKFDIGELNEIIGKCKNFSSENLEKILDLTLEMVCRSTIDDGNDGVMLSCIRDAVDGLGRVPPSSLPPSPSKQMIKESIDDEDKQMIKEPIYNERKWENAIERFKKIKGRDRYDEGNFKSTISSYENQLPEYREAAGELMVKNALENKRKAQNEKRSDMPTDVEVWGRAMWTALKGARYKGAKYDENMIYATIDSLGNDGPDRRNVAFGAVLAAIKNGKDAFVCIENATSKFDQDHNISVENYAREMAGENRTDNNVLGDGYCGYYATLYPFFRESFRTVQDSRGNPIEMPNPGVANFVKNTLLPFLVKEAENYFRSHSNIYNANDSAFSEHQILQEAEELIRSFEIFTSNGKGSKSRPWCNQAALAIMSNLFSRPIFEISPSITTAYIYLPGESLDFVTFACSVDDCKLPMWKLIEQEKFSLEGVEKIIAYANAVYGANLTRNSTLNELLNCFRNDPNVVAVRHDRGHFHAMPYSANKAQPSNSRSPNSSSSPGTQNKVNFDDFSKYLGSCIKNSESVNSVANPFEKNCQKYRVSPNTSEPVNPFPGGTPPRRNGGPVNSLSISPKESNSKHRVQPNAQGSKGTPPSAESLIDSPYRDQSQNPNDLSSPSSPGTPFNHSSSPNSKSQSISPDPNNQFNGSSNPSSPGSGKRGLFGFLKNPFGRK
jgi:hypothetical protein